MPNSIWKTCTSGLESPQKSYWIETLFTLHFSTSLCQRLGINWNISTAYHPQTDGLSERKNQWVEQYLQFMTSASQDDWSDWLTIATAVHNNYPNATTHIAPIEALLGYSPQITMELPYPPTTVQLIDNRMKEAMEKRKQAKEALNEAARATPPDFYQIGDKVWLEAKHLALPIRCPNLPPNIMDPLKSQKGCHLSHINWNSLQPGPFITSSMPHS